MPDESTPVSPQDPSDSADEILARAKLKEAEAALITAKTPFIDKLILRGLLPIALAIVGPWAALTFSEQTAEIGELQKLAEQEKEEAEERKARMEAWRTRMQRLEDEKAAELQAMSNMVTRLDSTLKTALIQMAVARMVSERTDNTAPAPTRADVGRDVAAQVSLPGLDEQEVQRLAEDSYDKIMRAKRK